MLFAILQKYDFSSKSQLLFHPLRFRGGCLRYCKSTIFQANHNKASYLFISSYVVCDTAKVRFFKQITTLNALQPNLALLFAILQKYDFSSKSQPPNTEKASTLGCLRYCKSTIFQANHNKLAPLLRLLTVVCDTAKVRFFKQITTSPPHLNFHQKLFAILQKYDFSSKSQLGWLDTLAYVRCLRYCKSTIFQANHNTTLVSSWRNKVVCDTAKVRFFKQITTSNV